jgi:hypothetical protein
LIFSWFYTIVVAVEGSMNYELRIKKEELRRKKKGITADFRLHN